MRVSSSLSSWVKTSESSVIPVMPSENPALSRKTENRTRGRSPASASPRQAAILSATIWMAKTSTCQATNKSTRGATSHSTRIAPAPAAVEARLVMRLTVT